MGDNFSFDVQIPSNNRTIQLTLNTGNTEATRFLVNWGDGAYSTASVSATGTVTNGSHTYSSAGAYTISVKEFKE
jgi:VCBS repeat-containing protein